MKIGKIIKNLRKTNQLLQKDLSELCGVSRAAVSLWEKDLTFPSPENLDKIAGVFGVRIEVANGGAVVTKVKPEAKPIEKPESKPERKNRVWIELPLPDSDEHAEEIESQINAMLSKLGDNQGWGFFWNAKQKMWEWAGPMGGSLLPDNGHWFNLTYLTKGV